MNKKILSAVVLGSLLSASYAFASNPYDAYDVPMNMDPGANMNRTMEMLERERVAQQIEEDRARAKNKLEAGGTEQAPDTAEFKISLQKITVDSSAVLEQQEVKAITDQYIGREVSAKDLYAMVDKINQLYKEKGYMTCRAFLTAQTIKDGELKVLLVEGRNGNVEVIGNKNTKTKYVTERMHLQKGDIPTVDGVNKDLLLFNATNDCQLRIMLKAGQEPGTTDYMLQVYEPKQHSVTVFSDNTGNHSTGVYREGLFYSAKSISGVRDNLSLGYVHSKGSNAFSTGYSRSINKLGTRMNLGISGNTVKQVDDYSTDGGRTKGRSNAVSLGVIHPLKVTDKLRSEVSLELTQQENKSDFLNPATAYRINIVDDTYRDATFGYALTNYGASHVIYQKHSLIWGKKNGDAEAFAEDETYFYYKGNGMYQKNYQHGQLLTGRGEVQWASKALPSAKSMYLGGMNSVRGYRESVIGSEKGINLSVEYSVPITKDRQAQFFTFADCGRLYGKGAASLNGDNKMASLGIGLRANIARTWFVSWDVARAVKTDFSAMNKDYNKYRMNFLVSASF